MPLLDAQSFCLIVFNAMHCHAMPYTQGRNAHIQEGRRYLQYLPRCKESPRMQCHFNKNLAGSDRLLVNSTLTHSR